VPPASPLIGKTFTIDFRLLELRDVAGSSPSQK